MVQAKSSWNCRRGLKEKGVLFMTVVGYSISTPRKRSALKATLTSGVASVLRTTGQLSLGEGQRALSNMH